MIVTQDRTSRSTSDRQRTASSEPGTRARVLGRSQFKYRADIDGLRAVAVVSVLAFHMELSGFNGGFVGVDIFFVISAYLISATIFADLAEGTYSVAAFYQRRIRRIVPALSTMLIVFTAWAVYCLFPSELVDYAKSLLAVAASVSNFYFLQHSSYFVSPKANPLLHTWSLAVEEQFYIFFPLYMLCVQRFIPKQKKLSVFILFCASFAASVILVSTKPSAAFYMPFTRAWELLLGTMLALRIFPPLYSRLQRNVAAFSGVAMIGYAVHAYSSITPFPGLAALLPCVGAGLIMYAGEEGSSFAGKILSSRVFVSVGLISYSLYLWHWPIIVLQKMGVLLSMRIMPQWIVGSMAPRHYDDLIEAVLSLTLAILSWRFIEQPFRKGRFKLSGRRLSLAFGGFVSLSAAFCLLVVQSQGLKGRMPLEAEQLAAYHSSFSRSFRMGSCFLTDEFTINDFNKKLCLALSGDKKNYLLLGDSHSATIWPGFAKSLPSVNVMQASVSACRPILQQSGTSTCRQMMSYIFQDFLLHNRVDGLFLEARWETRDIAGLTETIAWARQHQIPVTLIGSNPEYDAPLPRLLGYSIAWHQPDYAAQHRLTGTIRMDAEFQELAQTIWHVPYVSLYQALCDHETCIEYADAAHTLPMLTDADHFSEPGSLLAMQKVLDRERSSFVETSAKSSWPILP